MKKNFLLCLLASLALITLSFKVDETPLEKLLKQLAKLTATYPTEKVHLQTDKPYYAVGEDIWLKGYVVIAEKNEPSQLSKVLYVDLIDEKNEIKQNLTLSLTNGGGAGNFTIIDSLKSGNYRIRAYTNYMRNYDAHFFFEKTISIGNVMETGNMQAQEKDKKENIELQFFPEGGSLVSGIRSKVGVKAVLQNGIGANLNGYIIDENKEKVAQFSTAHAGMGIFAFMPKTKGKYKALITLQDGTEKSFNLPEILETGHTLAVNNSGENLTVKISSSQDLVGAKELLIVAQTNGVVYASFSAKIDKQIIVANIPKKNFPTGIAQFTLFTADGNPIAERLIFIDRADALNLDVTVKGNPLTKNKSGLAFSVSDMATNPIDGNFSVAVVDVSKVPVLEDEETTILSNLLLSSELKGFIENPNYYFNTANADRVAHLDNLLLTQGWRRFLWKDVIALKEPEMKFRPEQTYEITGKITGPYNKPLPKASVSLMSTTPGLFLKIDTLSDAKGNFVFDRLEIPDSSSFFIQSKIGKDNKEIKITLTPTAEVIPFVSVGNSINISKYLENTKIQFQELAKNNMINGSILLKTVEIQQKRILKPLLNVPNSANASGAVDYVITSKMLEGSINIFSPFYKSGGVLVKNGIIYRSRPPRSLSGSNPPMLLIIDGVQINQKEMPDYIQSINPTDVEGIEILTSDYNISVLGSDASGGAIYITTKKGGGKARPATNVAKVRNAGFSVTKEFYVPNYDDPKINKTLLDLRSTIYWNPNVITDKKGQATINFFNASNPGDYRVTIEGMDAFGNIGRKVYTYQVK